MAYPYQIKSLEQYHTDYKKSIVQPEKFSEDIAEHFTRQKLLNK